MKRVVKEGGHYVDKGNWRKDRKGCRGDLRAYIPGLKVPGGLRGKKIQGFEVVQLGKSHSKNQVELGGGGELIQTVVHHGDDG